MGKGSSGKSGGGYSGDYGSLSEKNYNRLVDLGARRWKTSDGGKDRLYLEQALPAMVGLKTESYKSGSIQYAELNGEKISNNRAKDIFGSFKNVYIDMKNLSVNGLPINQERKELILEAIDKYRKKK